MKVLLLAGYRFDTNPDDAPGLGLAADGEVVLDQRIVALRALDLTVVCVVAGLAADHQIRRARRLREVELVYDTHVKDASLVTNLRAGLNALLPHEICLVLPVELPCPPRDTWTHLKRAAFAAAPTVHAVRARDARGPGFPLLVTRAGIEHVARLADLKSLADTRLEYLSPSI